MANKTIDINGTTYPLTGSRVEWYSKKLKATFTGRVSKIIITSRGWNNDPQVCISVWRDKNNSLTRIEREYIKDPTGKYRWVKVEKQGLESRTVCFINPRSLYLVTP